MLWRWEKMSLPKASNFGNVSLVSGGFLMGLSKNTEKGGCFLYEWYIDMQWRKMI